MPNAVPGFAARDASATRGARVPLTHSKIAEVSAHSHVRRAADHGIHAAYDVPRCPGGATQTPRGVRQLPAMVGGGRALSHPHTRPCRFNPSDRRRREGRRRRVLLCRRFRGHPNAEQWLPADRAICWRKFDSDTGASSCWQRCIACTSEPLAQPHKALGHSGSLRPVIVSSAEGERAGDEIRRMVCFFLARTGLCRACRVLGGIVAARAGAHPMHERR